MANGPALGWNCRAVDARLREAFEAFDAAADPEWSPVRQAAFGRLRELGIPTARHEAFTYANPAPWFGSADADPFFAPAPPSAPRDRSPALPVCPNALCMRFPGDGENLLEEEIVRAENATDPLELLALSFADDFLHVAVPSAGDEALARIVVAPLPAPEGRRRTTAVRVKIAPSARVELDVLPAAADGDSDSWRHLSLFVELGAGARLDLVRAQPAPRDLVVTSSVAVRQAEGSVLRVREADGGGRLAREHLEIHLDGPGARCDLRSLAVLRGESELHRHVEVFHHAPACSSDQLYRQILFDSSFASVDGTVRVDRGADGTESNQLVRSLLLGENCAAAGKPQLLIHADDVQCDHGATHGPIEESELFYLLSRGLSPDEARLALIRGFAQEMVDAFPEGELKTVAGTQVRP